MGSRLHCKADNSDFKKKKKKISAHEAIKSFSRKQERWNIPTCIYKANQCLWCIADDP